MPTNKDAVLASIELIADSPDTAAEVIDEKIEFLKAELQRYISLRKMVCRKPPVGNGCSNASPEKLKAVADAVVKVLQAAKKPMPAREISEKINKVGFILDDWTMCCQRFKTEKRRQEYHACLASIPPLHNTQPKPASCNNP